MKLQQSILMGSLVAFGATTFFVEPSQAVIFTILQTCNEEDVGDFNIHCGPAKGLERRVQQTNRIKLTSWAETLIELIPHDGDALFQIPEQRDFRVKKATTAWANGFVDLNSTLSDKFQPGETVQLSTVWSQKLIPTSLLALTPSPPIPDASLTGFDPADPEMEPLDDGFFIGKKTGMLYRATSITTTLAGLSAVLPGQDLSAYDILGAPDSIVYVSQLTISSSDFICVTPEPSTLLSLLSLGILGSGAAYKRRLQGKSIKSEEND